MNDINKIFKILQRAILVDNYRIDQYEKIMSKLCICSTHWGNSPNPLIKLR